LRRYNLEGEGRKEQLVWTSQNEARTKIEREENRKISNNDAATTKNWSMRWMLWAAIY
jgi:hypothetical protein